jgi:hypothetical protein
MPAPMWPPALPVSSFHGDRMFTNWQSSQWYSVPAASAAPGGLVRGLRADLAVKERHHVGGHVQHFHEKVKSGSPGT